MTLSRRTFLKTTAATVAVPVFVPGSALGLAGDLPPSERVTIGHIGLGGRGGHNLRSFMRCTGVANVAVADCFADRREGFARAIQGKAYADFREILARDDIDAVVVSTPDHWHVPIANMAARAGKDAYIEKPLGMTIGDLLSCRDTFAETGRIFQYGTEQRNSVMLIGQENRRQEVFSWLGCELIRAGRIGKIQRIEVVAPNGGTGGSTDEAPVPDGFDYDMWCGPAPLAPYTVDRCRPQGTYWISDYAIGYLAGWGAHPLDMMVWADDSDISGPIAVEGTGKIPTEGLYDTVYDWDCKLRCANGMEITFKPGGDMVTFHGDEGWIRISYGGISTEPASLLDEVIKPEDAKLARATNSDQNFIDSVRERKTPVSNLADAIRSDTISHLCNVAIRIGKKVTWDPKAEKFLGDSADEAGKMLHRPPMREPWTL
jgi:hypothetical protein